MYQVELVWNREFDWRTYGAPHDTLAAAIKSAEYIENSGDGARVKKSRVVDSEGEICWQYGREVRP